MKTLYQPPIGSMAEFSSKIARRLQFIYKDQFSESTVNRILSLTAQPYYRFDEWNQHDMILITYGNSIQNKDERPFVTLKKFMAENLSGVISTVHILPFFPYTSDDGFAVSDYESVNPALGNWNDISDITSGFDMMVDLVINHVSTEHDWFKNYLKNESPGPGYFIEKQPGVDYSMVIRPRSSPLFTRFEAKTGEKHIWTTFSSDQADLNFANQDVLLEMIRILLLYLQKGARFIRLDAIAFLWKRNGTPCLHLPETHEIVKLIRDITDYVSPGSIIITETNVPNLENWSYFGKGDEARMVYQFSLPPLLLYALFSENSEYLNDWASSIPLTKDDQTFLNYTASHDGIGMRPLEGLIPETALASLIKGMTDFGGMISMKTNPDGSLSPYEINITFFDAMKGTMNGKDDLQEKRFVCSQTIMMSMKGIPAIYIHSLLASENDYKGVEYSGRARSINRQQIDLNAIKEQWSADKKRKRIFNELIRLMKIRKNCPAFHPNSQMHMLHNGNQCFSFVRIYEPAGRKTYCISNISSQTLMVRTLMQEKEKGLDLISGEKIAGSDPVLLEACQTRWIDVE